MRTIQIAPNRDECRIEGRKIIGTMGDSTFVYEIPARVKRERLPSDEQMIEDFRAAIAMGSKRWWVEEVLNNHWKIKCGKFYIL